MHGPRTLPLDRCRHRNKPLDAACRLVTGFPSRRRHQMHTVRCLMRTSHSHGIRDRRLGRTHFLACVAGWTVPDVVCHRRPILPPHRHLAHAARRGRAMRMGAAMPGMNGLTLDRWMKRHRETADPGVLATLAMQGIGGRWGQTIHGCILIRSGQMTQPRRGPALKQLFAPQVPARGWEPPADPVGTLVQQPL
jgi:hypothetical protein